MKLTAAASMLAMLIILLIGITGCSDNTERMTGNKHHPTTEQDKLWALAAGAILTESNHGKHNFLGGFPRTSSTDTWQKFLATQGWGIHNRSDLLQNLDWITREGNRKQFDKLAHEWSVATPAQLHDLRANRPDIANAMELLVKYSEEFGAKSFTAWDYDRYICLCGWGYLAGYLTEEEAWERIMPVARLLQHTFDSWKELGKNHLAGREIWASIQSVGGGDVMLNSYQKLLADPTSPWNTIPWTVNLAP
jgi:hypothetical protein